MLVFDLRDALRGLIRDRSYAATILLTLALTIGATTAVFSIVDGVLLRPLAYREPQQLVDLRETWGQLTQGVPGIKVNEQHFEYWRQHAQSFEALAQYISVPANLTGAGDAAQITMVRCSGSLLDVFGVEAARGRTFTPADERSGNPDVAVVTDAFWRQRLAADPQAVGRSIGLDGRSFLIVGVLPPDFSLPPVGRTAEAIDLFVPIRMDAERVGWVGDHNNYAVGRLTRGVTVEQAQAELNVLQTQVSVVATKEAHEPVTLASRVTPLTEAVVGKARRGLLMLFAAIVAVLLIASSNLANLSLTRTLGRQRERAIRAALGASQSRLVSRAVLEQLLLSVAGGALGVWLASMALRIFVRTAPIDLPRARDVALSGGVLAFAAAVSVAVGLLVAALPAWRLARGSAQSALRTAGTAFTSDRGAMRARGTLLALQVGLSVTLLVVTALLAVSFLRVLRLDRGFDAERVLVVNVSMPADRYADARTRLAVYDRLLAAVRGLPAVRSVSTASMLPLAGQGQVNFIVADGDASPKLEHPSANFRFIAPEYFQALGIPILRGRAFSTDERDPNRPSPAVVSAATAARLWPGQHAVGQRFSRGEAGEQGFEVVGVVADAHIATLEAQPPLMVYAPYWWRSRPSLSLLVKTAVDPLSIVSGVRRAVAGVDPDIAIARARPLDDVVDVAFAARRYQLRLFVAFGVVALLIVVVGVYGTTAYGVSRRRREMNIRLALGAERSQVLGMVVRQSSVPIAAGIAAGAAGSIAIGRLVAALLFEVTPRDPVVIGAVVALVAAIGLLACAIAARQGLALNPASALRDE